MALAILPIMNSTSVELLTKSVIQPLWASIISSGKQEQASPHWGSASGSAPRKPPPPLPMRPNVAHPCKGKGWASFCLVGGGLSCIFSMQNRARVSECAKHIVQWRQMPALAKRPGTGHPKVPCNTNFSGSDLYLYLWKILNLLAKMFYKDFVRSQIEESLH